MSTTAADTASTHEGQALKNYIKQRGINATFLCEKIGKSKNYLQAQYNKEVIDRRSLGLLNKGLGVDLYEVLYMDRNDAPPIVREEKVEYSNSKVIRERIIIDFEDSVIKAVKREFPDKISSEEQRIKKLENQLGKIHGLLLELTAK